MLIGIVSDSHDNLLLIDKAVQILNSQKVSLVLHAGDYVSPFTITKFKLLNCPLIGVLGNNDGDHELLKRRFSETTNCTIQGRFAQITREDFRIGLLHGDETELLNAIIESNHFDFVVHGHSHLQGIVRRGKTLAINPGELCGYLTGKPTITLLDTTRKEAITTEL
ncbi:MAG: metallophosphoesterase [Nitrososphaerota archaeon]|jgi:putative phosphoesterase|uniref:metallophosphoesterase n=1 Tax=Candidatus Bathycorpusculum sp. TaxID=2994959 RepID=UPI002828C67A|nr:metallophosphoesterase [Candidatus Termitimicrobium sp.]MCL2431987.1 metallophosphoesterase [Candidatus Termitimicrobium sp.]MDR0492590.1 metallophosphoesterase [Nitrososphaerota archaeon]